MRDGTPTEPEFTCSLARAMHARLRDLERGGRTVAVTPAMEAILLNDPEYVRRLRGVRRARHARLNASIEAARALGTTVSALVGEQDHPPVYSAAPSTLEEMRRRVHRDGSRAPSPFTVLIFPKGDDNRVFAIIAESPSAYAVASTEEEALDALREASDVVLTRAYEATLKAVEGRADFRQEPFAFHPPGAGRAV